MFSKGSRYKELPEVNTINSKGETVRSQALRWITEVPGTFLHTVNQSDRLDLLAYKYYGDPQKWWLICDANPEFSLPTDLLERSPLVEEIYTLEPGTDNQWALLINELNQLTGIYKLCPDVSYSINVRSLDESETRTESTVELVYTIDVVYNEKELTQKQIIEVIKSNRYKSIIKQQRIGQKIIIPPNRIV